MHYRSFCAHHHSEQLMQKYNIETQDLTSAFAKLPQLEQVCFDCGTRWVSLSDVPISLDQLSCIGRDTLVEPQSLGGSRFHAGQFTALMKAAHAVQKPLTTVKALDLHWNVFQQSEDMSAMMASAAKTCQHLAIEMNFERSRKKGEAGLAKMISSSPSLHTLEISLGFLVCRDRSLIVKLSKLFDADAHWPNLRRLC